MIKKRNVITLKVPFPNISSGLALKSHMYICISNKLLRYRFVKCQSFKYYMLINNPLKKFIIEKPDIKRNPFQKDTIIDCDKVFYIKNIKFSDDFLTTNRPDIVKQLYDKITSLLSLNKYEKINISIKKLKLINRHIE